MDLNDYFNPVSLDKPDNNIIADRSVFCRNISINTPDTPIPDPLGCDIALIGLPEEDDEVYHDPVLPADRIRNSLYQLFRISSTLRIADLGNLKTGKTRRDTYYALRDVSRELLEKEIIIINFGGTQDLTYGSFLAFESDSQPIGFVSVDSRLDMGIIEDEIRPDSYLIPILSRNREALLYYTNLGHQKYFVDQQDLDYLEQYFYQSIRLGDIRSNLSKTEPFLRDASLVSIDLSAIKQSDAPASTRPSPNGFYSEEICQICKYSGLSNKINSFGIYNLAGDGDAGNQTANLAAQMIWYFIEGYVQRIVEEPTPASRDYKKFIVNMNSLDHDIVFYKSHQTERWWCEIPILKASGKKPGSLIQSCSQEDYDRACNQEIPDRWWKAYKKLN